MTRNEGADAAYASFPGSCSWCKVSMSGDFGRSSVALSVERYAALRDQERQADEDDAGEQGVGGAVMADDVGRFGTSVEMLRDGFDGCGRVGGCRDAAASQSGDGYDDCCQRAEAGRSACGLHACLVAVLLGLPGFYAAQRGGMGPLGLVGFLTAFSGTYLIAVTGNFGFLAPVLAKQSPAVLDSINQYLPVVIINGLAAILFIIGYVLFGVAMIRTSTLPRWSGVLVAGGCSRSLTWFRDSTARHDRRLAGSRG